MQSISEQILWGKNQMFLSVVINPLLEAKKKLTLYLNNKEVLNLNSNSVLVFGKF